MGAPGERHAARGARRGHTNRRSHPGDGRRTLGVCLSTGASAPRLDGVRAGALGADRARARRGRVASAEQERPSRRRAPPADHARAPSALRGSTPRSRRSRSSRGTRSRPRRRAARARRPPAPRSSQSIPAAPSRSSRTRRPRRSNRSQDRRRGRTPEAPRAARTGRAAAGGAGPGCGRGAARRRGAVCRSGAPPEAIVGSWSSPDCLQTPFVAASTRDTSSSVTESSVRPLVSTCSSAIA